MSSDILERVSHWFALHGVAVLVRDFPPAVVEPIRLHVAAKRYLTGIEPTYLAGLSPVRLRRWDDRAKTPGMHTPALGYYLALADELRRPVPGLPAR